MNAHLGGKALPRKPRHGTRREHRKRRDEHNDNRHGSRGREHEGEGGDNRHHAVEQLCQTLQQTVAHLIHIVHHTRDIVTVGMAVDERERHAREFVIRLDAQIAHGGVREPIHAHALHPLQRSCGENGCRKPREQRHKHRHVHPSRTHNQVDRTPDQYGHEKLQHDGKRRAHERCHEQQDMRTYVGEDAASDLSRPHRLLRTVGIAATAGIAKIIQVVISRYGRRDGGGSGRGGIRIRHVRPPPPPPMQRHPSTTGTQRSRDTPRTSP